MRKNNLDLCLFEIERKPTKGFNKREFLVYIPVREVEWVRGSLEWQLPNINKEQRSDAKDIAHIVRLDLLSLYILLCNFKGVDGLRRKLCDRRGHYRPVRKRDSGCYTSISPSSQQMSIYVRYLWLTVIRINDEKSAN